MDMARVLRFLCSFGLLFSIGAFMISPSDPPQTQWIKNFKSDIGTYNHGNDVRQTLDGGFIIGGTASYWSVRYIGNMLVHYLRSHIYLVRTDKLGNLIWQMTYKNAENEEGYSVLQTADGGFLVVGWTTSFGAGNGDVYLMKVDGAGNFLWHKTYGGDKGEDASSLEETFDGGYIIAGISSSFGSTGADFYLIKIDASGNLLWQRTYGGTGRDFARSVQQSLDGGFIIAGDTESFGVGGSDVYLVKTDGTGNFLWQKTFGGNRYDYGRSVQQTYDGGYIVAGEITTYEENSIYIYQNIYLVKTDSVGNFLWQKLLGSPGNTGARAVIQTLNGGLMIAGSESVFGKSLIHTDNLGNIRWQTQFDSTSGPAYFRAVRQTFDRGFIVTGDDGLYVSLVKLAPEYPRITNGHRR